MAEAMGVMQIVVPVVIEAIKELREWIKKKQESSKLESDIKKQELQDDLEMHLNHLSSKVPLFESIIQCAGNKQDQVQPVRIWLEQLKEVLFDAEDLLDEYATGIAQEMKEYSTEVPSNVTVVSLATPVRVKRGWRAKVSTACRCFSGTTSTDHIDNHHDVDNVSEHKTEDIFKQSDFSSKIKCIVDELDRLEITWANLGLKFRSNDEAEAVNLEWRQTTSTPDQHLVVGRDDDRKQIKQMLVGNYTKEVDKPSSSKNQKDPSPTQLPIIGMDVVEKAILESLLHNDNKNRSQQPTLAILPIVGMGGLGKTTLAKMIFNDHDIGRSFGLRVWVCVSNNFHKQIIIRKIIHSIRTLQGKKEFKSTSLQDLELELLMLVQGEGLFLVLDDVWNDEAGSWDSFLNPLRAACKKSCGISILITTRIPKIAKAISGCMEPIYLTGLQEAEMWEVLRFHAFKNCTHLEDNMLHVLETIVKGIVGRLKGSPLAAKSIGRLLAAMHTEEHTEEHWTNVAKTDLYTLKQNEDDIIPVLRLSYQYLPPQLKRCLIYFSLFPKGYTFMKSEIVHIWIAHNCIECTTHKKVEDVGREYFDALVDRSFLEHVDEKCANREEFEIPGYRNELYSMHDLIHDLVRSVSKYDCYWQHDDNCENEIEIPSSVRHASFQSEDSVNLAANKKLRTLMIFRCVSDSFWTEIMDFTHINRLRVLVIKGQSQLSECTGYLKHLRVLHISGYGNKQLPESLGQLHNLQVLNLWNFCGSLPKTISRLVNLRHLICHPDIVSCLPGIGRLSLLHKLSIFCVQRKEGFCISNLKDLNMIQRILEIRNLGIVISKEKAESACLDKKIHLRELELYSSGGTTGEGAEDEVVFESLKPCKQLNNILLSNFTGRRLPTWMSNFWLTSLKSINLLNCEVEVLPASLGKMPFLKELSMWRLPCLKEIKCHRFSEDEDSIFPALERLHLEHLREWIGWSVEEGSNVADKNLVRVRSGTVLPWVKHLTFDSCSKVKCFAVLAPQLQLRGMCEVPSNKEHLQPFSFLESRNIEEENMSNRDTAATRGLLPSSQRDLGIYSMDDASLPHFLFIGGSSLTSLRILQIRSCIDLISCNLPATLTSLEQLEILFCPNLTSCRLPPAPKSLKKLQIFDCENITSVWLSSHILSIDMLDIFNCAKLGTDSPTSFPLSPSLSTKSVSPKHLRISGCNRKQLIGLLQGINHDDLKELDVTNSEDVDLKELDITNTKDVENSNDDDQELSAALLQLTSLTSLCMYHCQRLTSLPPNIERMELKSCLGLYSSPDMDPLTSLQSLEIRNCPNLKRLPGLDNLKSLQSLKICECGQISDLPDLALVTLLQSLEIQNCSKLKKLAGLDHLTSLRSLQIRNCWQLEDLPGLDHLTWLRSLLIERCPKLEGKVSSVYRVVNRNNVPIRTLL